MTEQEKTLIAGCVKGEKAAWDAFVQQYSNLVYHTIRKTFVSYHVESESDLVDDLFQEFFLAIVLDDFKKLRQFRGDRGCSLASWLRLLAARLTIDLLRKRVSSTAETAVPIVQSNDPVDNALSEEQGNLLNRAIEALPPRDRLIIELSFHHNLPLQSVAKILKTSVPAVYTQKSRILTKLREILK